MGNDKIWWHKSKDGFRYWLHWGKTCWRYEGYLGKRANHTMIELKLGGDENDVTFALGIRGLFNFWIGVEDLFSSKIMRKLFDYDGRLYELTAYNDYICFDFHRDEYGYSKKWKGVHLMWNWKETLFGKWEYKKDTFEAKRVHIPMPEGDYPATVEISNVSRGYKRAKKKLTTEYSFVLDIPIPYQGKGENYYDLGEDGTYGFNTSASSLEEAIQHLSDSCLKTRIKYGGENWTPKNGWEVQKLGINN